MNKIMLCIDLLLCGIALPSCVGSPVFKNNAGFDNVEGRDWLLEEFKSGSSTVRIDRTKAGGIDIYSIRFEKGSLSGIGAPNRLFSSYTFGNDNSLTIRSIASYRMGPIFEDKNLSEFNYFGYLERVSRWNLRDGKLELYTSSENGEAVFIFR